MLDSGAHFLKEEADGRGRGGGTWSGCGVDERGEHLFTVSQLRTYRAVEVRKGHTHDAHAQCTLHIAQV